ALSIGPTPGAASRNERRARHPCTAPTFLRRTVARRPRWVADPSRRHGPCTPDCVAKPSVRHIPLTRNVAAEGGGYDGSSTQLRRDANDAQVQPAAFSAAASNGFTDGVGGAQVIVNHPPSGGFYAGNDRFVEAIVKQPRPTIFMSILGFQSASVGTRAVAGAQDSPNCIYALHPTANHAFNTTGSASVSAACGVIVDSNSGSAMNSSGSAGVTATSIAVTGNTAGCCYSPTPTTGVPPEPDPLAGRAAPTVGSCDYINKSISSNPTAVLTPGVY